MPAIKAEADYQKSHADFSKENIKTDWWMNKLKEAGTAVGGFGLGVSGVSRIKGGGGWSGKNPGFNPKTMGTFDKKTGLIHER